LYLKEYKQSKLHIHLKDLADIKVDEKNPSKLVFIQKNGKTRYLQTHLADVNKQFVKELKEKYSKIYSPLRIFSEIC
jgi:hypothetical protein